MRQLLFILLCLSALTMGKYVCSGKTFLPAAGSPDFGASAIAKNAVLRADTTAKNNDPWIRTEFIPSKFTNDRKIQQELSKFLLHRKWKSDCRTLLLQTDEKQFEYFNFKDTEQRIAAFDFDNDNTIIAVGEVFNGSDDALGYRQLTYDEIVKLDKIINQCSPSGITKPTPSGKSDKYLCGKMIFDMNKDISGYIIINKTSYINDYGRQSNWVNTYLIIQNRMHILSILELTTSFSGIGHAAYSRAIRVADNLLVAQSESSSDAIIEGTQEEAEKLGIKNHAVFKVYEVMEDGYIVGRN